MTRLFVGLRLPQSVRQNLLSRQGGIDDVRWQNDDQLHITLRFIGEVNGTLFHDIRDQLSQIYAPAFDVKLKGVGLFGKISKPRILWAGIEDEGPIRHLHEKIDNCLRHMGVAPETKKFKPHVTLARFKGRPAWGLEKFMMLNHALTSETFTAAEIVLFSSHLAHSGAIYSEEARYPLMGAIPDTAFMESLNLDIIGANEFEQPF